MGMLICFSGHCGSKSSGLLRDSLFVFKLAPQFDKVGPCFRRKEKATTRTHRTEHDL